MKKIIFISIFTIFLVCLVQIVFIRRDVYSQSITQDIKEQLITNIASRVAQLKLVEKRGIVGTVTSATNTQITLTDLENNTRFVDVDELTKFSSPKSKGAYGISDITKDATLGVLGLYNKESRRLLARFITVVSMPEVVSGGVISIDDKNFTVDVLTIEGKKLTTDIEFSTTTHSYTPLSGYIRSGFSKIKEGYSIIVTGSVDSKNDNKITATRVVIFPEIPFVAKNNPPSGGQNNPPSEK